MTLWLSPVSPTYRMWHNKIIAYDQAAKKHRVYVRSVKVALVVGSLLNIINQPKLILGICLIDLNALHDVSYLKALLTYLVPFFVSLHGALSVLDASFINNQNQRDRHNLK
jgi:hypothetical protein